MKVAVVVSVGYEPLDLLVAEILEVLSRYEVVTVVILATHSDLDPRGSAMAKETARRYTDGNVIVSLACGPGSFSRAYLAGWQKGAEVADIVISMDADGSHDPQDLRSFMPHLLAGKSAVMASRFLPGASNTFPLQRRRVSWLGTMLTNIVLRPKQRLTDFTSGFEGLRADVVKQLFAKYPQKTWVSMVNGPYHLQNTELRLRILELGFPIVEVPISYGAKKKGKKLKLRYLVQALRGFVKIATKR